mmetsp:Transcript_65206/g.103302  ORF Transcript_65206/g.103302 Transcript_65206/m.103302 type:complete len:104 (-) Transcript_65206:419-730(-)
MLTIFLFLSQKITYGNSRENRRMVKIVAYVWRLHSRGYLVTLLPENIIQAFREPHHQNMKEQLKPMLIALPRRTAATAHLSEGEAGHVLQNEGEAKWSLLTSG